jgi:WD40 repeat protein
VSFCNADPRYLICGLDKNKNECGLMVWDIEQARTAVEHAIQDLTKKSDDALTASEGASPFGGEGMRRESTDSADKPHLTQRTTRASSLTLPSGNTHAPVKTADFEIKPIQQYGLAESTSSAIWIHHSANEIVAGMLNKYIRVFDIRDPRNAPMLTVSTKAVYGLACDPFHPYRISSFGENDFVVNIWDLRKFNADIPALTIQTSEQEAKSESYSTFYSSNASMQVYGLESAVFSSSRPGLLATLHRESRSIKIWELQEGTTKMLKMQAVSMRKFKKKDTSTSMLAAPQSASFLATCFTPGRSSCTSPSGRGRAVSKLL